MVEFEELKIKFQNYNYQLDELKDTIRYDHLLSEICKLESKLSQDGFWDNINNSQAILQQINQYKVKQKKYDDLVILYNDVITLIELADEAEDLSLIDEISNLILDFKNNLKAQNLETLLNGNHDNNNAILTFHAGAGGTEAQDWTKMLVRLYTRWGEKHNFKVDLLDFLDGDGAGYKSAVLHMTGPNAYGYLKGESGVHRLIRISPFDASGKRHTSFSSIEVMPEINEDIKIDIKNEDLKVDTYRSGGAGGQHVNKTESAIRITHIPTGIVVACQNERSQHQNREVAMKMLKSKLIEIKEREHLDKIEDIKGVQKEIAWGSQIRSYVFMPYTLVKDHRTNIENGNINAVMDGDIDDFINAYLKYQNIKGDK